MSQTVKKEQLEVSTRALQPRREGEVYVVTHFLRNDQTAEDRARHLYLQKRPWTLLKNSY